MSHRYMDTIDMTGKVVERLTVLYRIKNDSKGRACWQCKCTCGNETTAVGKALRQKKKKSCGCLKIDLIRQRATTHGHSRERTSSPIRFSWTAMTQRCANPKNKEYRNYMARGITVYEPWKKFENFLADIVKEIGERKKGTTLERKDNNKGYEPGNVRWATPKEQCNNQRTNRRITLNSRTLTVAQWAEEKGLPYMTIMARLNRHPEWEAEKLLSSQMRIKRKRI